MPRRRRIVINKTIEDEWVERFKSLNPKEVLKERVKEYSKLASQVEKIVRQSEKLYKEHRVNSKDLMSMGLLPVQKAYEYLRSRGYEISFRAFGGRIERGSIPSVKFGRKRYIPVQFLEDLLNLDNKFYTVRKAYEIYKKYEPNITFRAFIGRVEKGTLPSIKLGSRRLIPKEALDALTHVAKNYYSISQAMKVLRKNGIKIRRNAFERRIDRGRIPHVKIGGRRFIHKDVLNELIEKEKALKK